MPLALIDAACPHCLNRFRAAPNRSFLGFQKLVCQNCGRNVLYPLTKGYRFTYWALFLFMVISIAAAYSRGGIGLPGGFGIAVAIALFRDWQIKRRLNTGREAQRPAPAVSATPSQPVWPENAEGTSSQMSAVNIDRPIDAASPSQASWAQALGELEGNDRHAGLWARLFAEAGGVESTAKAKYLQHRSVEIEAREISERKVEEAKRVGEREAAEAERQRALRKAHQLAEEKAKVFRLKEPP